MVGTDPDDVIELPETWLEEAVADAEPFVDTED
jgi:hypothetical protein